MAVALYYAPDLIWRRILVERCGIAVSEPRPRRWGRTVEAATGGRQTTVFAATSAFEVYLTGILEGETRRDLSTFAEWARRGSPFALSADHTKTVGVWADAPIAPGATSIPVGSNEWASLEPSASLPVAERNLVWLRSQSPEYASEVRDLASLNTPWLELNEPTTYAFNEGPVLVTWRHFYPFLRLRLEALDGEIMTSRDGLHYVWSMKLEVEESVTAMGVAGRSPDGQVGSVGGSLLSEAYEIESPYFGVLL